LAILFVILAISRVMPYVQTRYILTVGFVLLGASMLYSHQLVPDINYGTLVWMRIAQSVAIGFLFVPASTLTYLTLPRYQTGDGTALFTMFRNIAGSIGISLSTALITSRTQVQMAYLTDHLTPLASAYADTLARVAQTLRTTGQNVMDPIQGAAGMLYRTLLYQASILAYLDVFSVCALLAFAFVPITFLFDPAKSAGGNTGG
jgi:DHA2 family multidrug resistance protein